jgi:hypothetical protein
MMPQTTIANVRTNIYQSGPKKNRFRIYLIAAVGSWNNIGIKKECDEFDDRIEIEEHDNLLATWSGPKTRVVDSLNYVLTIKEFHLPTAVYLLRM